MTAVTFSSDNKIGDCPGMLHGDASSKIGLIVLQEWWGMNEQIIQRGKELAEMGNFMTVVPDLYRGKVAIDREQAGHYSGELDWDGAVQDIQGAARFLLSKGCAKVGVTGYCQGGALSLLAAARQIPEISASAPFYGIPKPERGDVATITIPVQAHFGELDDKKGFSSPEDAKKLAEVLAGNKDFELFMYPAGHSFTNPNSPNYNKEASELALGRTVSFMQKCLGS